MALWPPPPLPSTMLECRRPKKSELNGLGGNSQAASSKPRLQQSRLGSEKPVLHWAPGCDVRGRGDIRGRGDVRSGDVGEWLCRMW